MGMYDSLYCDVKLPGMQKPSTEEFQTKSLEKALATYRITAGGKLVEENSGPMGGEEENASKKKEPIPYDGTIEFHGNGTRYSAHFFDGQLQRIKMIDGPAALVGQFIDYSYLGRGSKEAAGGQGRA